MRKAWRLVSPLVDLAAIAGVVYGVSLVYVPAAWVVSGLLVLFANAIIDRLVRG